MAEQNRGELRHYISKTEAGTFNRLAKGISTLGNNLNPQEVTHTYIDDSSSTTTTAFQEEWPVEGVVYSGDAAANMLRDMARKRAKGDDATIYHIVGDHWVEGSTADTFEAYRQKCTWSPASDGGGDGGSDVTFSGSLKAKGAPVYGTIAITAATETTPEIAVFTAA